MYTRARRLPAPDLQFGGNNFNPGSAGSWDFRGKEFFASNNSPLQSWGIGYFLGGRNSPIPEPVNRFASSLVSIYRQHGGNVSRPAVVIGLKEKVDDAAKTLYRTMGSKNNMEPQLPSCLLSQTKTRPPI